MAISFDWMLKQFMILDVMYGFIVKAIDANIKERA